MKHCRMPNFGHCNEKWYGPTPLFFIIASNRGLVIFTMFIVFSSEITYYTVLVRSISPLLGTHFFMSQWVKQFDHALRKGSFFCHSWFGHKKFPKKCSYCWSKGWVIVEQIAARMQWYCCTDRKRGKRHFLIINVVLADLVISGENFCLFFQPRTCTKKRQKRFVSCFVLGRWQWKQR